LLPLLFCLASPLRAEDEPAEAPQSQPGETEDELTADEEIDALLGPQHEETMIVTASRKEESLLDAPVSITVVGELQIETSPAENMADLLRGVPGLNAAQTSARQISVSTRTPTSALANSQLVMVDGRSIYQDFFGLVMWDVLPVQLDELKQVEVLRGPGSAVWGANALSGVVNVRTKTPRELEGGVLWGQWGEQETAAGGVRWADAHERFSYKISASWFEQAAWDRENTFNDGTPIPDSFQFDNEGTEQPKLDLRLDYERDDKRWVYKAGHGGTSGIMHSGIGPFQIRRGSAMQYYEFSYEGGDRNGKIYLNRMDGDALNLLNGLEFLFKTDTLVGEISQSSELGERHDLIYGGNVRSNKFDLSLAPDEDERLELGSFVEDRITLSERWTLNLGLRADYADTIDWTVSPRTSLLYKPSELQSWRFAYNRAFRAPSLINNYLDTAVPNLYLFEDDRQFVFATFALGSEDLTEETVDAFEIGWTGVVGSSMLNAAVYYNITNDLIDFAADTYYSESDPPNGWPGSIELPERELVKVFKYRNVGQTVDKGLELAVDTWWSPHLNTTFSYSFQDETEVTEDDPDEPLIPNIAPTHQFSAGFSYRGARWSGSFQASYTDRAFWADVLDYRFWGYTDAYWLLNGSFGGRFFHDALEFRISGTNLTDKKIKQHVFGDIIERKVGIDLKWRF
jgi:iron complex outermembrane receptor protein